MSSDIKLKLIEDAVKTYAKQLKEDIQNCEQTTTYHLGKEQAFEEQYEYFKLTFQKLMDCEL